MMELVLSAEEYLENALPLLRELENHFGHRRYPSNGVRLQIFSGLPTLHQIDSRPIRCKIG